MHHVFPISFKNKEDAVVCVRSFVGFFFLPLWYQCKTSKKSFSGNRKLDHSREKLRVKFSFNICDFIVH